MATWAAWSRRASDADLVEIARQRFAGGAGPWCFIEGPTSSDFVGVEDLAVRTGDAWLVRVFGEDGELAARRMGFDSERPWLVRIIGREAPAGDGWHRHEIDAGTEQAMVLYGTADALGRFVEGQQFREPFQYPGVAAQVEGERATLAVQAHAAGVGGPVVRWVALRPLGKRATPGRT